MPLNFFSKTPLPETLPEEMRSVVSNLKKSRDKKECLKKVYEVLTKKYHGDRMKTYLHFFSVFTKDPKSLWRRNGFLHCTNLNYLARILLVRSGFFTEADLRLRWALIWCVSPHQYLQVHLDNTWINIDLWGRIYGIPFVDHAHGFHSRFVPN